jgi:ubiquinone/menaquinone biosynthesis C-methylase UbiE
VSSTWSEAARVEEARIQAAYAKRSHEDTRYSWFNSAYLFMMHERERQVLALLSRYNIPALPNKTILEVGCGRGYWLCEFIKWGARPELVTGVELLPDRVAEARHVCPEGVTIDCGSAAELVYPNATFDLVVQSTVFTSILDSEMKQRIATEMLRVVKPGGMILWYDYHVNNPRNPDVQGVKKREIAQLFPQCAIHLQRVTLAPPLVRLLARYSWSACSWLGKIPLLCTHYLGVIRKGGSSADSISSVSRSHDC